jgi:hypothetical protein
MDVSAFKITAVNAFLDHLLALQPMSQMGHFRPINDVCAMSAFRQIAP